MEVLSFNDETENRPKKKLISWSSGKSNSRKAKSEPKAVSVQPQAVVKQAEASRPVYKEEPRLEMPKSQPEPFVFPKIEPEVTEVVKEEPRVEEPKLVIPEPPKAVVELVKEPEPVAEAKPALDIKPVEEPKLIVEPVVVEEPEPVIEPVVVKEPEPVIEPVVVKEPEPVIEPVVIKEPEPVIESVVVKEPEPVMEPIIAKEPEADLAISEEEELVETTDKEEFNPYTDEEDSIDIKEADTETGKEILSGLADAPDEVIVESDELQMPSLEEMEAELDAYNYQKKFGNVVRNAVITVIVVAAFAVIVAMMFLPILQIDGSSMSNTLSNGDIVVSLSHSDCKTGDVVAFYYNNNILVKRVIASPGQWVDIEDDGSVYVDGALIDEPYVTEKAFGDCNITLPYQVPDGRYFVMGDHRSTSIDSRNTSIGCIASEMVIGKVICRVWPLTKLGTID